MASNQEAQDAKDYQDYQDYQRYIATAKPSPKPMINDQAAMEGFGQGVLMGYLPELQAVAGALVPDPSSSVDEKLRAQGFKINQPEDTYSQRRAENIARQEQFAKEDPYSYYGGQVVGTLATAPTIGKAIRGVGVTKELPKGAGLIAKAGQMGKEGATVGALMNPNTRADDEGLNLSERLKGGMAGGLISGTLPVAAAGVKKGAGLAADAAKWTGTKTLSAVGGVHPNVIKEYTKFSDRINQAPSMEKIKEVADNFLNKLGRDVDEKKLTFDQSKEAYKAFESDVKESLKIAGYDAKEALASAKQTLKDAHSARVQALSQDIYDTVAQLKKDVGKGSSESFDILTMSDESLPVAPLKRKVTLLLKEIKVAGASAIGDDAKAAVAQLQSIRDSLNKFPKELPMVEVKKMLQQLQRSTQYSYGAGEHSQTADKALRELNRAINEKLKSNPEYAAKMEQVAADTGLLGRVEDFGDKAKAAGLLTRLDAPNQLERRAALGELGKKYNADFIKAATPESLPEYGLLQKAEAKAEQFRPDRVAQRAEDTLAASRQRAELSASERALAEAKMKAEPFSSVSQANTQAKLQALAKGKNIELEKLFKEMGKLTDTDFVQAMQDQRILEAFEKSATQGSRNVAMGGLIGFMMGGVYGATSGGSIGYALDKYGPAVTKKILDASIKVSRSPTIKTIADLDLPEDLKRRLVIGLHEQGSKYRPGEKKK